MDRIKLVFLTLSLFMTDFPDLPNLIHWAIPFFALAVLVEVILSARAKSKAYEAKDALSSIAMGLGNVLIDLLNKALIFGAYYWVYQFHFFEFGFGILAWIFCFFAEDFSYYWFHRASHSIRFFWASHVIHHSSQNYTLATALRQTWTGKTTGAFLFWMWMPLLGFHPIMIFFLQSISLLYQFWIHTEHIKKMPAWFEYIFNTPSHHRVHHGSDPEYLDRNHAGVLVIWDRMFGTFVEEKHKPTYGLTDNIHSHNPFIIATHEWWSMIKDVRNYPQYALGYIFKPPGWSHDGSRKTSKQMRDQIKKNK